MLPDWCWIVDSKNCCCHQSLIDSIQASMEHINTRDRIQSASFTHIDSYFARCVRQHKSIWSLKIWLFIYGLELIFHSDCFILYFILRTVPYTYFIHNEPRSNTESSCYLWFFVITVKMKWTEIFICQECPDPRAWGLQTSQASGDQSGRIPGEESWENAAPALTIGCGASRGHGG